MNIGVGYGTERDFLKIDLGQVLFPALLIFTLRFRQFLG